MIEFPHRYNLVRFVNPATADIFDIELSQSCNCVSFVSPVKVDISDIELSPSFRVVRLVAVSSPVKLLTLAFCAVSEINVSISAAEIESPDALPRADSILARRLESGMFTAVVAGELFRLTSVILIVTVIVSVKLPSETVIVTV